MSETPPTGEPDDASTESESREHNLLDAESAFLEDRDPEAYPPVLRITSDSDERHRREALDRLERWESGESVPHVINFEKPSDLRSLLTDRRLDLLRSVMGDRPASIRRLAERVDRDVKSVHDDLQILAEYDIVHFEQDGRAKRPFVPYETIEVSLEISAASSADGAAPA
ncbi:hypothetical protein C479_10225 [Halovivax asiaticus JCM 14624]|uniref:Uncharacterized protein n=1 Tax=Halovivax asiaticus JCM 14624 TaxID=1227490 RepID=M0BHK7_9EURY|nr:hypothetical protein [Halovivax asiaticus]ELZ09942.1 hypothetical protein C479_10225 [Halovivax asiaticus JCM 14624]